MFKELEEKDNLVEETITVLQSIILELNIDQYGRNKEKFKRQSLMLV